MRQGGAAPPPVAPGAPCYATHTSPPENKSVQTLYYLVLETLFLDTLDLWFVRKHQFASKCVPKWSMLRAFSLSRQTISDELFIINKEDQRPEEV